VKQRYKSFLSILIVSNFLLCQEVILQFKDGQAKKGDFVGTYMNHVHLLIGEDLLYFSCEDINKIVKVKPNLDVESFSYSCNENTVTPDILFPPFLNPMTGEWETNIPAVFNSEIQSNQIEENKKESENAISEFEIKELIRSAVKKEISKDREITNSYIQANQNKISKLEDEIKNLKSRRSRTKPSNSDLLSFQNPLEILGVCCIGYLMLIVMTSF
tara:strand:+ start:70 stop:717 length:648 start_codon:yes stop_codon:yes gene_type:complete